MRNKTENPFNLKDDKTIDNNGKSQKSTFKKTKEPIGNIYNP